ncbi:DUF6858 family protein [Thauera mechernichensis]
MREADPQVALIEVFDHLAHIRAIGGDIHPGILTAKNLVFCFGAKPPDPTMMAVRTVRSASPNCRSAS